MEKDDSSFLMRLLGGNITGKVIKNAPCPVLVVGAA
jgi:nucleotide-binding universal stress UspA family protein